MKSKLISCVLLILLLIGCADNDAPTVKKRDDFKETSKQTEKRLNWIGHWLLEYGRETLVQEVAQDFELMNPDIDINLKYPQHIMGLRGKQEMAKYIVKMIETGDIKWDVVWLDDRIYQYVAEELRDPHWGQKHLVNFEEVDGFKQTQKSFIIDNPIYREQTGGIIIGPYIEGFYFLMYYNKDVAENMDIEVKHADMTYDDLLSYLKAVDQYNKKHDTNIRALYECNDFLSSETLFQSLFKSELGNFDMAKEGVGSNKKNAALLKTFQAFEEMGRYIPLLDSHTSSPWFQTRHYPLEGKCLFDVRGAWMYSHWMGIDKEKTAKMVPVELPVFQKVDYYLGSFIQAWAVMKDGANKEEAIKLLMFWSRPQVAEKWVRYAKAPTGLVGNISSSDIGDDPFDQFITRITDKYGSNVHYSANAGYILGKKNRLLQQNINEKLLQLLDKNITAQQAYDEIMKEVK
ncbi:ABC transporter substrate-binding protein [Desulfobacula sp.]|uniref:ABC transporter substrate-binding protein n=1 Tax=Desulfobacula sp. TaxID=2593537 RepID=UPI0025C40C29|nr:ABC transporter substrate-binding protein [Desulfobacula sp.]MBC2704614.1 carbohydrate ABC transporter substrate-binding protein [Desulfobacula sp.]